MEEYTKYSLLKEEQERKEKLEEQKERELL